MDLCRECTFPTTIAKHIPVGRTVFDAIKTELSISN